MRFKTLATGLAAVVLTTVLVPIAVTTPAVAQSQTSWYVNDDPSLFGPSQYWYRCDPGHGYGSNNCRFTYAIGGESTAGNWARWNMGSRDGRQEIQVYVPSNHATATVNYNITIGRSTSKVRVAQNGTRGWHSLGNWNTNGANVVIAVYDNDASHHWDRDGYASSSIGVDAIRMRCVSNCGPPPPTPPPSPQSSYDEINDLPSRTGGPWYRGSSGAGYGSNNFRYTYVRGATNASGTLITRSNRASWTFTGVPEGNCEVSVYVPSARATGDATYHFYENESGNYTKFARLDQGDHSGWTRLTTLDAEGGEIRIHLRNYPSRSQSVTVDSRGYQYNRIAADAMRLRCGSISLPQYPFRNSADPGRNEYTCRRYKQWSDEAAQIVGWITAGTGDVDPWNFYGGECTSYVAFRLNQAAIPFRNNFLDSNGVSGRFGHARYWTQMGGSGNESAVSLHNRIISFSSDKSRKFRVTINSTPAAGAVAHWTQADGPVSANGHIGYVEGVVDSNTIVVSDMNGQSQCMIVENMEVRRGDGWSAVSRRWPGRFIHFEEVGS